MAPDLLALLACPICKGPLTESQEGLELACMHDGTRFPIYDGVPVLLRSEGRRGGGHGERDERLRRSRTGDS